MMTTSKPNLSRWLRHFENNAARPDGVPWGRDKAIPCDERRLISRSIATFQLGESSEGHNLMRFAKAHAERAGEPCLPRITRLFIQEEQKHAALLARFMASHAIPLAHRNWTDVVFRGLRKRAGYELSISILILAEIIALLYYPALKRVTSSAVLKAVCDRLVEDEKHHVRYEAQMIHYLRVDQAPVRRAVTVLAHRLLFAGTVVAVWLDHRRIVGSFGRFWRRAWSEFHGAFREAKRSCDRVNGEIGDSHELLDPRPSGPGSSPDGTTAAFERATGDPRHG